MGFQQGKRQAVALTTTLFKGQLKLFLVGRLMDIYFILYYFH